MVQTSVHAQAETNFDSDGPILDDIHSTLPKDRIIATVLSIAGEIILGPKDFARAGLVAEIRTELASLRPRQEIKLVCDGCVLKDDYVATDDDLSLCATFEQ